VGFKAILVTVDAAPTVRVRLELAANLAERFNAHLVGLQASISPDAPQTRGYFEYFNRSLDAFHEEFAKRMLAEAAAAQAPGIPSPRNGARRPALPRKRRHCTAGTRI
jgi:nucleotide-binding universal stress UspA family protein